MKEKAVGLNGSKSVWNKLLWHSDKKRLEPMLAETASLQSLFNPALALDNKAIGIDISKRFGNMEVEIATIASSISSLTDHSERIEATTSMIDENTGAKEGNTVSEESKLIAEWVLSGELDDHSQKWHPLLQTQTGSGEWFTGTRHFKEWRDNPSRTFYCWGRPGVGKTILAAVAIHKLHEHLRKISSDGESAVICLFCDYNARTEQNSVHLLRALLRQPAKSKSVTPKPLKDLYVKSDMGQLPLGPNELLGVIQSTALTFTKIFVVMDALDECNSPNRVHLLRDLHSLQRSCDIRVLITCRYLPGVERIMGPKTTLEVPARDSDMEPYVHKRLDELPSCICDNPHTRDRVMDAVVTGANGL